MILFVHDKIFVEILVTDVDFFQRGPSYDHGRTVDSEHLTALVELFPI